MRISVKCLPFCLFGKRLLAERPSRLPEYPISLGGIPPFQDYLAPVAQKLINKKPGEEVELESEQGPRTCRIDSIEAATPMTQTA